LAKENSFNDGIGKCREGREQADDQKKIEKEIISPTIHHFGKGIPGGELTGGFMGGCPWITLDSGNGEAGGSSSGGRVFSGTFTGGGLRQMFVLAWSLM